MNHISLIGRTTDNIDLRKTGTGKSVCSFTLAVKRPYAKDVTDFIPCVAWERTAEFLNEYCPKGSMIGVEGTLNVDKREKDGQTRTYYTVKADRVDLCSTPSKINAPQKAVSTPVEKDFEEDGGIVIESDDLPF